jgi:hypothetical protein
MPQNNNIVTSPILGKMAPGLILEEARSDVDTGTDGHQKKFRTGTSILYSARI